MKRFVIIGLGNFGMSVAESLNAKGHDVIAIDSDEEVVDMVSRYVSRAVVGDGSNLTLLDRIGARGADGAVVSTGDDITSSVLTTLALQDVEVKQIFVKVVSAEHARVMERLGVTESIFPERESAISLGSRLSERALFRHVRLGLGSSLHELGVPESWQGKSLRDLNLPGIFSVTVVAIHNISSDFMSIPPDPDLILDSSTTLLVAGTDENLSKLSQLK
ncbi:MAG TPA: TrkA family potassium uptake protein [Oligoflexia bacterium]|nr:TrkA family potassium uptake protein [Oligoflexia bacterium]HMP47184.1 TrkA family potassium uptake protein [Oligoflexia bacterium]